MTDGLSRLSVCPEISLCWYYIIRRVAQPRTLEECILPPSSPQSTRNGDSYGCHLTSSCILFRTPPEAWISIISDRLPLSIRRLFKKEISSWGTLPVSCVCVPSLRRRQVAASGPVLQHESQSERDKPAPCQLESCKYHRYPPNPCIPARTCGGAVEQDR